MNENELETARTGADADRGRRRKERWPSLVVAVCLAVFTIQAVTSMVQESSTWDETHYFGLGKYLLQHRRWDVPGSILHPPLSYYLHSIPLLFFPTDPNVWKSDAARVNDPQYLASADIARGQALLSGPLNRGDRLLNLSRLMMVLTAVVLGWFVYSWSYALYGKWSALLAAVLYSFSPNILAHARLITPDIAVTTFSFMTLFYFWRLLSEDRTGHAILGGLCLGLALLSKFTGLLLIPICLVLMVIWRAKAKALNARRGLVFAAIGIGVLCLGYGMNLKPYFAGIAFQQEHTSIGHPAFLLGHYSTSGWWYYFIVAFLIKTPIATMVFLAISLASFIGKIRKGPWVEEAFLLIPVAVFFCFFSVKHQAIGLRYILPIYPFLFVFASSAVRSFMSKKFLTGLSVALAAWYVGASCYIHPHYLAYFNELAGGPDRGYKYLADSNLDWGQDLKGLEGYMRKHAIAKINLSYFGSDSPDRYGIAYDWLPSYVLKNPTPGRDWHSPKGWVAISAVNLQGVYFEDRNLFAWFRERQPAAKIGYSIFIYKMDD